MRYLIGITLFIIVFVIFAQNYFSKEDQYEVGVHWDYNIICENGFTYKVLEKRKGTIQILNSDGTPLKCNEKYY